MRLIEIKQKPVSERALRRRLIQSVPLESLPPVFAVFIEAIKTWDEVAKGWDKALVKARGEAVKAWNEARNDFTRLCTLHKGALEVLHRERCLSIHPDCPWNGERLVGIG